MKNIGLMVLFISSCLAPVFSYTVLDNYYDNALYTEDSTRTVSQKINYPGYFTDTTSSSNVALGFLKQEYSSSSSYINSSDLYGWTETKTGIGKIGVYLGNLSFSDSKQDSLLVSNSTNLTGSGALWFVPKIQSQLKGISLSVNGDYSNSYNSSSYFYSSTDDYTYYESPYGRQYNQKCVSIALSVVLKLNPEHDLLIGICGQDSFIAINKYENLSYSSNYYPYTLYSNNSGTSDSSDFKNGAINIGFVNKSGRYLGIGISGSLNSHQYSAFASSSSFAENTRWYNSSKSEYVKYLDGKVFNYLGHSLFLGLNAYAGILHKSYSTSGAIEISRLNTVDMPFQEYSLSVSLPILLKMHVFNLPLYALAKITPYGNITYN